MPFLRLFLCGRFRRIKYYWKKDVVGERVLKSAARDHDLNIAQEPAGNKFNRNILLLES